MPSNIIEVPIRRRSWATKEVFYQDPKTGKKALRGREWTDPETAQSCGLQVYGANGEVLFDWDLKRDGPLDQHAFKAADYMSRESFKMRGVL